MSYFIHFSFLAPFHKISIYTEATEDTIEEAEKKKQKKTNRKKGERQADKTTRKGTTKQSDNDTTKQTTSTLVLRRGLSYLLTTVSEVMLVGTGNQKRLEFLVTSGTIRVANQ